MISVKHTPLYEQVLKEFNYEFGDVFVFKGYLISEISEGINFTWEDHGKRIVEDVSKFIGGNGADIVYLSHRIHSYSVKPNGWVKFFKGNYELKGYGVVGYSSKSFLNTLIENLFFTQKIRRFNDLDAAVQWATHDILTNADS
ncbi:hypothetical protein AB9K24_05100 [Meridianimaribacter flavus]